MSQETTHIPKLRFPEFEGEWIISTIGEDCKFSSGGTPSKENSSFWNGDIPWISAVSMHKDKIDDSELKVTELGSKNGARIAPKGSILILVRGSMLYNRIPAGICQKDVTFNQDVKCLQVSNRSSSDFFLHSLRSSENRLLSIVTGTGIGAGKIDSAELKAFPFLIPSISEQQKIASFLTEVDKKIDLLQRKKDQLTAYKKGMMQKLFSQEIRFKDEDGKDFPEWEEKILADVMQESLVKGAKGDKAQKLTVKLWGKGVYFKGSRGSANTQYYKRKSGQFIYSKLDFLNQAFGVISKELDGMESTVDLPCFDIIDGSDTKFLLERIQQKNFYKKYGDMADGSRKAKRVHAHTFLRFSLFLPHPDEQQKIADYLTALDQKIELVDKKLTQAQSFKKGLLQQMFI